MTDHLQKKIASVRRQIDRLDKRIKAMQRGEWRKRKQREDRRRYLAGVYYIETSEKEGRSKELLQIMDKWLTEDRDRHVWGLPLLSAQSGLFAHHDQGRFERRRCFHVGSYFLETSRAEGREVELYKILQKRFPAPRDAELFITTEKEEENGE